jgi:hypothetical protein
MTSKLPGKARFQIGIVVLAWGIVAPVSVPGLLVGAIVGLAGFLIADGLWAAMEGGEG